MPSRQHTIVRDHPRNRRRGRYHPPATWMGELLVCACGHGIGKHAARVCEGDLRGACGCTLSPESVLTAATLAVRER